MRCRDVLQTLKTLIKYADKPNILVLHFGGNDIGQIPTGDLRFSIISILEEIMTLFPSALLVWSQMLPRLKWRNEISHKALNRARSRVNNKIASFVLRSGGAYLRYPELNEQDIGLFHSDGVHLSSMGNNIFLYRLSQGLQRLIMNGACVSPDSGETGPWQCSN